MLGYKLVCVDEDSKYDGKEYLWYFGQYDV